MCMNDQTPTNVQRVIHEVSRKFRLLSHIVPHPNPVRRLSFLLLYVWKENGHYFRHHFKVAILFYVKRLNWAELWYDGNLWWQLVHNNKHAADFRLRCSMICQKIQHAPKHKSQSTYRTFVISRLVSDYISEEDSVLFSCQVFQQEYQSS